MTDDSEDEWGPLIFWDGGPCPPDVKVGMFIELHITCRNCGPSHSKVNQGFADRGIVQGDCWLHAGFGLRAFLTTRDPFQIDAYRIRKSRGMQMIEDALKNSVEKPKKGRLVVNKPKRFTNA